MFPLNYTRLHLLFPNIIKFRKNLFKKILLKMYAPVSKNVNQITLV